MGINIIRNALHIYSSGTAANKLKITIKFLSEWMMDFFFCGRRFLYPIDPSAGLNSLRGSAFMKKKKYGLHKSGTCCHPTRNRFVLYRVLGWWCLLCASWLLFHCVKFCFCCVTISIDPRCICLCDMYPWNGSYRWKHVKFIIRFEMQRGTDPRQISNSEMSTNWQGFSSRTAISAAVYIHRGNIDEMWGGAIYSIENACSNSLDK